MCLLRIIKNKRSATIPTNVGILTANSRAILFWGAKPVFGSFGAVVAAGIVQVGTVIVLACKVTAAFCANTLPLSVAPVARLMDVRAMIVPTKVEFEPSEEAELGAVQKTLHACAPLARMTLLADAVTKSDEA